VSHTLAPGRAMPLAAGRSVTGIARSLVFLPRSHPHRFWAAGPTARLLLIAVLGGVEDYFAEFNAASSDGERGCYPWTDAMSDTG
jgi:hypothetical protein